MVTASLLAFLSPFRWPLPDEYLWSCSHVLTLKHFSVWFTIVSKISSITPSFPYKLLALLSPYPLHQATSDHGVVMMQRGGGHCTFPLDGPVEAFDLKSIHYP